MRTLLRLWGLSLDLRRCGLLAAFAFMVIVNALGQARPVHVKSEEAFKLLVLVPAPPMFPPLMKAARMSATVRAEFTVGPDGRVSDVTNTSPDSSWVFENFASGVFKGLLFHPYMQDGLPVAMRTSAELVYANGATRWVWSDTLPAATPAVAPSAAPANVLANSPPASGSSDGRRYQGPNAEMLSTVLATVGPHTCDGANGPPVPPKVAACQRDMLVRQAQMIAVTAECKAAAGDQSRASQLTGVMVMELKAARALCEKAGEPKTCQTDTVLSCSKLPQ
jgi:hypothetical protein